jgi:hypothetical protein
LICFKRSYNKGCRSFQPNKCPLRLKIYISEKELRDIIDELLDFVSVIPSTKDIIKRSLKSKYNDFEDGVQILTAESIESMSFIVTRNVKDFKESNLNILTPQDFNQHYKIK